MTNSSLPKVAVLTPVYNGEAYLRDAMASVQAQTYPNLIHFVLDNASTDQTPQIIKEFQGGRVPITYERNEELLPIGRNWNKCVKLGAASADYFRILCADDTITPDSIAKMVELAEMDRAIMLVGSHRRTSQGIDEYKWDAGRRIFTGQEVIRGCLLEDGAAFAPPHLLFRGTVLSIRPAFYDDSIMAFDTEIAFLILAQPGAKFGFVHEPIAFTRRHADTITQTVVAEGHRDYFDWLVIVSRYGGYGLAPSELAEYKRAFLRHYFGRMLVWRFRHGNRDAFDWHVSALRSIGESPGTLDYLDSVARYCCRKVGLGSRWSGYPQG